MTVQLITDAIKKLEEAQEELRTNGKDLVLELKNNQAHYEISTALSTLRYTLSTL